MAKDPAFLFYSSDFLTGTFTMSDKQVGQYIRLMCLQHQGGHLTEEKMLSVCKKHDDAIWSKFTQDGEGLYYNTRLESETIKRDAYSESRRNNRSKKTVCETHEDTYVEHMENEIIYRDKDIDNPKDTGKGVQGKNQSKPKKKAFVPPALEEVSAYCKERNSSVDPQRFYDYFTTGGWKDSKGEPVRNWKQKLITWEGNRGRDKPDTQPKPLRKLAAVDCE